MTDTLDLAALRALAERQAARIAELEAALAEYVADRLEIERVRGLLENAESDLAALRSSPPAWKRNVSGALEWAITQAIEARVQDVECALTEVYDFLL